MSKTRLWLHLEAALPSQLEPVEPDCVSVLQPAYSKLVPAEGMPLSQYPGLRGDLILTFDTQFPPKLSPESKRLIKHALSI